MEEIIGILSREEIRTAERCLEMALEKGAAKARVTLNKSLMELFGTLDGRLDKVSHCLDRSMSVCLFVNGRYGSFSTNRLVESELGGFLDKSVATVRMLAEDPCRDLPDPSRTAKDAQTGKELDLYDPAYPSITSADRLKMAMEASVFERHKSEGLISEEGEYSDSVYDTLTIDSNGLRCRHTETSFEYGVEMTVKDPEGNRYSGYWWDSTPRIGDLRIATCCETAFQRAMAQIGPKRIPSGKYTMVVDSENSSRLVTPLTNALGAFALQQKNSFLLDTLGKKVFPEWMSLVDRPLAKKQIGSRLFDSEGVAARETPVIKDGVVMEYFVNTYMSRKMGIDPTIEDVMRPVLEPCVAPGLKKPAGLDKDGIMDLVRDGILVTGFNGGNSNSATGDFSFGVEGFLFRDGKIVHPVREILINGNLVTLWNILIAAGEDARSCKSKIIPTLAFKDVDFSA
ncbi:MAG: TldD/PmbA family protein [Bacteroidales bacterium]|nr:TldD/PmbA family protein [Bacteroidales bacterium]